MSKESHVRYFVTIAENPSGVVSIRGATPGPRSGIS